MYALTEEEAQVCGAFSSSTEDGASEALVGQKC